MAEEIIFKVGVDTGDSVQDVNKVGDAIEGVDKEAKKTSGSFVNLKKELRQLTIQLQGLDPASKEFEQVAARAGKIKEQLRGVADAINDADPEKFGGKFQRTAEGIAGAFSAVTGAQALFGKNSEEIEKQMLKVQGAIALTQGISAMKELKNDAGDLAMSIKSKVIGAFTSLTTAEIANAQATGTMTALQKAYAFAVGTSTGAMKIFKIALASTGIGLLIVGLGLAADAMGLFGNSSDEAAEKIKKLKEQQEKHKQQLQGELDLLTKLRQERKGGSNDLEAQIKILKAKGATDKEIYNAERELIRKGLDELSFAEGFKGKLNLEERTRKRQLKTDLIALDAEYYRSVQEKQETDNKESLAKEKERNAKIKEEKEKARREQLELERKIQDLTIANIEDTDTREIIALTTKHSRELEEIQKQYGKKKEFAELEKQLTIQQGIELENLKKEQATKTEEQKQAEKDKANLDAKSQLEADLIRAEQDFNLKQQKRIELENLDFEQQMANTTLTNGEREKITAQHEANLVGIADESKERQLQIDLALKESKQQLITAVGSIFGELAGLAKQGSAIQKAFAITQVAIDTATALSGLTAISFSPTNGDNVINPLGPYIKLATGTAKIISNMARVKGILGSGVSVTPPTIGGANANLGANTTNGTQPQQQVQAQSTYKVVVVDSDITNMQNKTKKVQAISTI
jgi:hypothetical protein